MVTRVQVFRRADEPRLNIGDAMEIRDGVKGMVIARFAPSSDHTKIGYIVETFQVPQPGAHRD